MTTINPPTEEINVADLKILGLTSTSEVQTIENKLLKIDGVQKVSVNLVMAKARVEYDPTKIVIETLIESVEDIGFGALDLVKSRTNTQNFSFRIIGFCEKCRETFVDILMKKDGIIDVKVNFDSKRVQVTFNNTITSIEEIKNCIFDFENQRVN